MKKFLFAVALAALFISCEKDNGIHTGDATGALYGIWALDTKTEIYKSGENERTEETDYSSAHFFLSLSEPMLALAKKGSFTEFDLKDVDVDGVLFSYDANKKIISFRKTLWLSDEFFSYNMILNGSFDVLELTQQKFVISQTGVLGNKTVYSYHRYK